MSGTGQNLRDGKIFRERVESAHVVQVAMREEKS